MTDGQSLIDSASLRKYGWTRYSLRALLACLTIVGVVLGLNANRAHRQRIAAERVLALGGTVYYEHQISSSPNQPGLMSVDQDAEPPGPAWLRRICGDHFFQRVATVELRRTNATDSDMELLDTFPSLKSLDLSYTQITDRGLEHVGRLSELRSLALIDTKITDRGVTHLAGLNRLETLSLWKTSVTDEALTTVGQFTNLRSLVLDETQITDHGLVHLQGLTNLEEWLGLCYTHVTDSGVAHLVGFKKLRHLNLIGAKVSDDGLRKLRRRLPQTDISPM
jgi:hypothetical protein